jgi:hypothetical protein
MTVGRLLNFAQEKKKGNDDEFHLYPKGENVAFQQNKFEKTEVRKNTKTFSNPRLFFLVPVEHITTTIIYL